MIEVVSNYLVFLLLLQPIEECYNCNNPNTIGNTPHIICNWEESDFVEYRGKNYLKLENKNDNFFERYYRKKYWRELGYN